MEAALFRLRHDVLALGAGVGNGSDFRFGIMPRHPEGERAPAAAELEDVLAVSELRAAAGDLQHPRLGLGDVGDALLPVSGGVFHVLAEAAL